MKYYLAPLEGITTYIYRRAYHTHYRPMEKYFTPFLVPHTKKDFNTREKNDILPEHNPDMYLVPQILANDAKGFLDTVEKLKMYGYESWMPIEDRSIERAGIRIPDPYREVGTVPG